MNPEQAAHPIGLTVQELDFGHFPAKNGFPGIPVKAWIRFPDCAELVDGEVYAWTASAVEVTWRDGPMTYRTWVWSPAVTPREDKTGRNRGGDAQTMTAATATTTADETAFGRGRPLHRRRHPPGRRA